MLGSSRVVQLGCALALGFGLILVPQVSQAADEDHLARNDEDVLITDRDLLEKLGFDRNARNVYMAPDVELELEADDSLAPSPKLGALTNAIPSGTVDFATVAGKSFTGRLDTTGERWRYGEAQGVGLTRQGPEALAEAQVHGLPSGGTLQFLRWWWTDVVAGSIRIFVFEICHPAFAGGVPTIAIIAQDTSFDSGNGSRAVAIPARTIDNRSCQYLARASFQGTPGGGLQLHKARLQFTHP